MSENESTKSVLKPIKYSITSQSLLILLFVTLFPLVVSSIILIQINQRFLEHSLLEEQARMATQVANELNHFANTIQKNLSFLADMQNSPWLSSEKRGDYLVFSLERYPYLTQLYIQENSNVLIASTEKATPNLAAHSIGQQAYQRAMDGSAYISESYLSPQKDDLLINFATPIRDKMGIPTAVLVGEVSLLPTLNQIIASVYQTSSDNSLYSTLRGGVVCILDQRGHLIAHPDRERVLKQEDMSTLEIVQKYFLTQIPMTGTVGTIPFRAKDGTEMIGSITKVESLDWRVLIQASRAEAYKTVTQMKETTIRWSLFGVGLAILIGIAFARQITRPIRSFVHGALQIAEGDFSQRIAVSSKNEIGQLADTFNYMIGQLQLYDQEMKDLYISTIRALVAAIDAKDPYTRGHSERVAYYSCEIGKEMELVSEEIETLYIGALLHDIGKIGINDHILKGGKLSSDEYQIIQRHPLMGAEIMLPIKQLHDVIPIIKYHHERFNGEGYPEGLMGEDIPLKAMIVGVADTYDAMLSNRPYQDAMPVEYVLQKLEEWAGVRYHPRVISALVRVYEKGLLTIDPPFQTSDWYRQSGSKFSK